MNTPLDPSVIARMARTLDSLHSVPIFVLADTHARFERVKPGQIVSDGRAFFVPESAWPCLHSALLKLRPDSALHRRTAS